MAKKKEEAKKKASFDVIEEAFNELQETIGEEIKSTYKKHKDFFKKIGTEATLEMFKNIVPGNEDGLERIAYYSYIQKLSDEEFLELKKKKVGEARQWAYAERKKKEIPKELLSKVGQQAANIIVRAILLKADEMGEKI